MSGRTWSSTSPRAAPPSDDLLAAFIGAGDGGATGWVVSVTMGSDGELFFGADLATDGAPLAERGFAGSRAEELALSFDAAAFDGCRSNRGTVNSKNATTT